MLCNCVVADCSSVVFFKRVLASFILLVVLKKIGLTVNIYVLGNCRCSTECIFVKTKIGCYQFNDRDACFDNQELIMEDESTGFCQCIKGSIQMEDYPGCYYLYSQGPCPYGEEVQMGSEDVGVCFVSDVCGIEYQQIAFKFPEFLE